MLLSKPELRENRYSEGHGLLKDVYGALPSIYAFFFRVWQYSVQKMDTNDYWVVAIFVKIVAVKAMVCWRAYMKLCHQFMQFSSEFGNILYRRWPQMIIEWCRFSWKSSQWKPCFTEGRKWSCAVNLCSFLPSLAIFGTGDGHKWLLSGGDFRENRRSESHSYWRAYMKLCHQFIQFSSEFGNIQYRRWPQMIIEWWRFSWKSSQWKPYFPLGT